MTSLLGRVFDAVSSFSGRKKVTESVTEESTSQQDDMATTTAAEKSNPKKRLFEDEDDEDTTKAPEQDLSFKIDKEFARKYEHNKKREEKQKLEEKYGKAAAGAAEDDEDSSDDESEDEAGYLLTDDLDARMTAALAAIKNKDPRIYDAQTKFFDPAEIDKIGEESAQAQSSESKQKPMFLRDYHRERYLSGDVGAEDDDDAEAEAAPPKTYQQEQDEVKRALVDAMNADDEEADDDKEGDEDEDEDDIDSFIKPKAGKKSAGDVSAPRPKITDADVANADKNPELFLSNFLAARAWVPEGDDETGPGWRAFESDDDEGQEEARAEAFEVAYNMRFEDPNASNEVLKSYARDAVQAQTVRRDQKTARQRQREQEKERLAAEKRERHEERTRLRKLRIEDAQRKLAQIKQAAGIQGGKVLSEDAWTELLDGAWDTDKWEAQMREQFGDGYYAEVDAERASEGEEEKEEGGDKKKKTKKPKKPKWDDDIDIKDIIPEFEDATPKVSLSDVEGEEKGEDNEEEEDNEDEDEDEQHSAKRRKTGKDRKQERADAKRQARRERARIEALVDRQMELDAPTALAGPSSASASASANAAGFRYRETSPQSFGLTARDILLAPSDTALNEFAGLKKLATFRDEERKRKDRKMLGKKARLRQWRRDTFGEEYEKTGPTYGFERVVGETAASQKPHKKSKGNGKGKDKVQAEEKEAKEADGEKSGKKRKRSGRKGGKDKKKEKPAAQEA